MLGSTAVWLTTLASSTPPEGECRPVLASQHQQTLLCTLTTPYPHTCSPRLGCWRHIARQYSDLIGSDTRSSGLGILRPTELRDRYRSPRPTSTQHSHAHASASFHADLWFTEAAFSHLLLTPHCKAGRRVAMPPTLPRCGEWPRACPASQATKRWSQEATSVCLGGLHARWS